MKALPILQSGFLALSDLNLVKGSEGKSEDLFSTLTTKPFKEKFNPYFYDPEVEDLFTQYLASRDLLKNVEFREKILRKAKYSLGGYKSFMLNQLNSPYLSSMHTKFLIDTLRYVDKGSKREIDIVSYPQLVRIKTGKMDNKGLYNYINTKLDGELIHRDVAYGRPSELLAYWTKRRYGFIDLLYTLKIIFGKVVDRVQV